MLLQDAKAILSLGDRPQKKVFVDAWNAEVYIRMLPASFSDRTDVLSETGQSTLENLRSRLVVASLVKEDGTQIFNDRQVEKVSQMSAKAIGELVGHIMEFNALGEEEVEELAKN